jgi:hypothetical protein
MSAHKMPGFTAERSLGKRVAQYSPNATYSLHNDKALNVIVPQIDNRHICEVMMRQCHNGVEWACDRVERYCGHGIPS